MRARQIRNIATAAASLFVLLSPVAASAQQAEVASIAGTYDGSQTEIAATLELGADGRYRYALSYGAVDEFSSGTWVRQDGGILLNSDPSTPPQFELLGTEPGSGSRDAVTIRLEGTGSLPLPLFSAFVERGDGASSTMDFSEARLEIPVAPADQVLSISPALPMFEVRGEPLTVAQPAGKTLYFAFHANDLGFKAFDNATLFESDGMLLLERYDREIVFRRIGN